MQIVSFRDNLYEMSMPISGKHKKNIISLLSAEFAQRVAVVNEMVHFFWIYTVCKVPV